MVLTIADVDDWRARCSGTKRNIQPFRFTESQFWLFENTDIDYSEQGFRLSRVEFETEYIQILERSIRYPYNRSPEDKKVLPVILHHFQQFVLHKVVDLKPDQQRRYEDVGINWNHLVHLLELQIKSQILCMEDPGRIEMGELIIDTDRLRDASVQELLQEYFEVKEILESHRMKGHADAFQPTGEDSKLSDISVATTLDSAIHESD